ncbi:MAG: hypothetical protein KKA79_10810 [Nanoarchaeota archaeon]|nr:hypothetical protein [Nanoarchaeota archaeon]MCG2717414.1 hypothetical protein [Nanoarchaeota archaeon]
MSKIKRALAIAALAALVGCTTIPKNNVPKNNFPKSREYTQLESLVLEKTKDNQTVMFGDKHLEYSKDSEFVINILPELKQQGFDYLALEIDTSTKDPDFSKKVKKFIKKYDKGGYNIADLMKFSVGLDDEELDSIDRYFLRNFIDYTDGRQKGFSFFMRDVSRLIAPGWKELVDAGKDNGFKIVLYDAAVGSYETFNERDEVSYKNLKERIFDNDHDAKVIIYCGSAHLGEDSLYDQNIILWDIIILDKTTGGLYNSIGYHLNKHTKDRNLAVDLSPSDDMPGVDISLDLDKQKVN